MIATLEQGVGIFGAESRSGTSNSSKGAEPVRCAECSTLRLRGEVYKARDGSYYCFQVCLGEYLDNEPAEVLTGRVRIK